jgi:hypothetical protein
MSALTPGTGTLTTPSTTLYRVSAVSLVLGCALLAIGDLTRVAIGDEPGNTLVASGWFLQAIGAMLALLGLPGIYVRQGAITAVTSLVGLIGISLYLFLFGIFGGLLHALVVPELVKEGVTKPLGVSLAFFAGALFAVIGSLSLGISTIRAGVLPRSVGILVIVGGLILFFGHPLGMHVEDLGLLLLMAGLGWVGYDLGFRAVSTGQRAERSHRRSPEPHGS